MTSVFFRVANVVARSRTPIFANYCPVLRSFPLFVSSPFLSTFALLISLCVLSYQSALDMGCVQSTGIDNEAKARGYSLPTILALLHRLLTRQAMTRLKTNSKRIECWQRTRSKCCFLERESLERFVLVHGNDVLHSPTCSHLQSTVLKQMKLIHHGGYNDQERDSYKEIIYSNTIQSMRYARLSLPLAARCNTPSV